jgi:hypothetical protein
MLIRYIYETIANWKLQSFFVDDYKLTSERYSQHVCGVAIGLYMYGGVGDIIYRRGALGHCIFAAYTNQHNIWCRITRVHVPRLQGDRITILRTRHCVFVTSDIFRLHACLETLYIVLDDRDWTSQLYFVDDYKLLVQILRPSGPICICVGSLFIAIMLASVQEC